MLQLNPQNRAGKRHFGAPPEHPSPEPVEYILSDRPEDAPTTTGGTSSRAPDYLAEIFEIWQNFTDFATICKIMAEFSRKLLIFQTDFLLKF